MTKFADQLFEDLMQEHGATLRTLSQQGAPSTAGHAPRRRRATRPAWLTAGVATATGTLAAGFVLFGGGAAPAYAVTQNPDGTLSLAVQQASAIDAANARLKILGARVAVVPVRAGCPSLDSLAVKDPSRSPISLSFQKRDDGSITVSATGVPQGDTMVIGFDSSHGGLMTGAAIVKGKVPSCVSLPAPTTPPPGSVRSGSQSGTQSGTGDPGTTVKR